MELSKTLDTVEVGNTLAPSYNSGDDLFNSKHVLLFQHREVVVVETPYTLLYGYGS